MASAPHPRLLRAHGRARRHEPATTLAVLLCTAALLGSGCSGGARQTGTTGSTLAGPVARGHVLYTQDGCSGCHALDGSRLTGPSWKGLAASRVQLSDGHTVTASDAYLRAHIVEPQRFTVAGYPGEVMAQATAPLQLREHPQEVSALIAFIDSLR